MALVVCRPMAARQVTVRCRRAAANYRRYCRQTTASALAQCCCGDNPETRWFETTGVRSKNQATERTNVPSQRELRMITSSITRVGRPRKWHALICRVSYGNTRMNSWKNVGSLMWWFDKAHHLWILRVHQTNIQMTHRLTTTKPHLGGLLLCSPVLLLTD